MGPITIARKWMAATLSLVLACSPIAGAAGALLASPARAAADEPDVTQTVALGDTVPAFSLASNAPTQVQIHAIEVSQAGTVFVEHALTDADGTWYLSADTLARHTGYTLDRESMTMERYTRAECPSYARTVRLNPAERSLSVRTYTGELKDAIEFGGLVYLPIHQVLPLLDCKAAVEDGALRIERAEWSMLQVMHDLDLGSLMFDAQAEFDGKPWAYLIQVGGSFVWTNITNLKDAALRLVGAGVVSDYEDVFTGYVTDGDAYERASQLLSEADENDLDTLDDALSGLDALFGLVDCVAKDYERAGDIEALYAYVDQAHLQAAGVIGDGAVLVGNAIGAYLDTMMMVEDNQSMLRAVYPTAFDGSGSMLTARAQAAQAVWQRFEAGDFWGTVGATIEAEVRDIGGEALAGSALGFTTVGAAELTGYLMGKVLDASGVTAIDDLAMLQYHLAFIEDAYRAHLNAQTGFTYDQAGCERLRLTALGALLASKACFEAIRDNNTDNAEFVSYCDARIANITEKCAELYLAATGELVEGRDYFEKAIPQLDSELSGLASVSSIVDGMTWRDFYAQAFAQDADTYVRLIDVTGDGVGELVVSHYGTGELGYDESMSTEIFVDPDYVRMYQLVDGVPQMLFDVTAWPPRSKNHRVLAIATDLEGHTGVLSIDDYLLDDGTHYFNAVFYTLQPVTIEWRTLHFDEQTGLESYAYDATGQVSASSQTDTVFNGPYLGEFLDAFANITVVLNTLGDDSLTRILGYANRLVDARVNDLTRFGYLAEQDVWAANGVTLAMPAGATSAQAAGGQPAWVDEALVANVDALVQAWVFSTTFSMTDYLGIWFEGDASALTMHAAYDDGTGVLTECVTPVRAEMNWDGTLNIYDDGALFAQLPAVASRFNGAASYYLSYYASSGTLSIYADNGMWFQLAGAAITPATAGPIEPVGVVETGTPSTGDPYAYDSSAGGYPGESQALVDAGMWTGWLDDGGWVGLFFAYTDGQLWMCVSVEDAALAESQYFEVPCQVAYDQSGRLVVDDAGLLAMYSGAIAMQCGYDYTLALSDAWDALTLESTTAAWLTFTR